MSESQNSETEKTTPAKSDNDWADICDKPDDERELLKDDCRPKIPVGTPAEPEIKTNEKRGKGRDKIKNYENYYGKYPENGRHFDKQSSKRGHVKNLSDMKYNRSDNKRRDYNFKARDNSYTSRLLATPQVPIVEPPVAKVGPEVVNNFLNTPVDESQRMNYLFGSTKSQDENSSKNVVMTGAQTRNNRSNNTYNKVRNSNINDGQAASHSTNIDPINLMSSPQTVNTTVVGAEIHQIPPSINPSVMDVQHNQANFMFAHGNEMFIAPGYNKVNSLDMVQPMPNVWPNNQPSVYNNMKHPDIDDHHPRTADTGIPPYVYGMNDPFYAQHTHPMSRGLSKIPSAKAAPAYYNYPSNYTNMPAQHPTVIPCSLPSKIPMNVASPGIPQPFNGNMAPGFCPMMANGVINNTSIPQPNMNFVIGAPHGMDICGMVPTSQSTYSQPISMCGNSQAEFSHGMPCADVYEKGMINSDRQNVTPSSNINDATDSLNVNDIHCNVPEPVKCSIVASQSNFKDWKRLIPMKPEVDQTHSNKATLQSSNIINKQKVSFNKHYFKQTYAQVVLSSEPQH